MAPSLKEISKLIRAAREEAAQAYAAMPAPEPPRRAEWPLTCTVGPGLEGAIACESRVGYVNGSRGQLIYRGYDLFDLCEHSTFEEVSYLLLHGRLPNDRQYEAFKQRLVQYRELPFTQRRMMSFPVEEMNPMSALRLGVDLMRRRLSWRDDESARPSTAEAIAADEDSIAMETRPRGEERAIYEFRPRRMPRPSHARKTTDDAVSVQACMHLISGMATLLGCIARLRVEKLPIDPDPALSHAANLLYMMTGRRPSAAEERVMDVSLILHADHGMNASTFASLVVASTLSDIYFSVGAGIGALNGPLHGGANEQVLKELEEIGSADSVPAWYARARRQKRRISGFGHRVYKTYDPRARILGPLAHYLCRFNPEVREIHATAKALEEAVISTLGKEKGIFPNVDFYSGLVYRCMNIPDALFTPIFAVSRASGWTARVLEYLQCNRIFRPRALYVGDFGQDYAPISQRD